MQVLLTFHLPETYSQHAEKVFCIQVAHKVLAGSSDSSGVPWDARVNAARMLTELLMFYISRHDMYRSGGSSAVAGTLCSNGPVDVTAPLDELLTTQVAPLLQHMMLNGCDPMPLYAQKVLATLLPRCAADFSGAQHFVQN